MEWLDQVAVTQVDQWEALCDWQILLPLAGTRPGKGSGYRVGCLRGGAAFKGTGEAAGGLVGGVLYWCYPQWS